MSRNCVLHMTPFALSIFSHDNEEYVRGIHFLELRSLLFCASWQWQLPCCRRFFIISARLDIPPRRLNSEKGAPNPETLENRSGYACLAAQYLVPQAASLPLNVPKGTFIFDAAKWARNRDSVPLGKGYSQAPFLEYVRDYPWVVYSLIRDIPGEGSYRGYGWPQGGLYKPLRVSSAQSFIVYRRSS